MGGDFFGWEYYYRLIYIMLQNSSDLDRFITTASWPLSGCDVMATFTSNISIGTTTLYTVPTGKKAMVLGGTGWNSSGGNIVATWVYGVGGVDHRMSPDTTIGTLAQHVVTPQTAFLNAGDTVKITTTTNNGLNQWTKILEFDANSQVKSVFLEAPASGNNTLYTVPTGKKAIIGATGAGFASAIVYFSNESGAAKTFYCNLVPSGGAVATTNQITGNITANDEAINTSGNTNAVMAAGDFINVNLSAAATASLAWVNIFETNA